MSNVDIWQKIKKIKKEKKIKIQKTMTKQKTMTMRGKHVSVHFHVCNPEPPPGFKKIKKPASQSESSKNDYYFF
jgi:hypothetical protein